MDISDLKLGKSAGSDDDAKPDVDGYDDEAANEAAETLAKAITSGDGEAMVRQMRLLLDLIRED